MLATVQVTKFIVPSGTNVSNIIPARGGYDDALRGILTAEGAADGAITYTLEVTSDPDPSVSSTWRTFQYLNGAVYADFIPPNVNTKAVAIPEAAFAATGMRIKSSANVTANRTFGFSKQYEQT